jgi:hypothetical protein
MMNRNILILVVLLLVLAACAPVVNQSDAASTGEATPTAALPTQTATTQIVDTPSYAPTLEPTERDALIYSFLANNGGCEYPCFWGITPGVSAWEDTRNYLASFGTIRDFEDDPPVYTAIFTNPTLINGEFTFIFMTNNDQISYIGALTSMTVSEVLQQYGMPDEIQTAILTSPEGVRTDYLFVYLERGFFIRYMIDFIYHMPEITPNENGFSIYLCPRDFIPDYVSTHNYYYLVAWDPNSEQSFEEVYDQMAPILNSLAPVYNEIRTVSDIDLEQFFAIWLNETDDCFTLECPKCVNHFYQ